MNTSEPGRRAPALDRLREDLTKPVTPAILPMPEAVRKGVGTNMDACDEAIPPDQEERKRLREAAETYVRRLDLVPPLSLDDLGRHAEAVRRLAGSAPATLRFLTVLVSNALWGPTIAALPYERRVFLLPQCLRAVGVCRADMDGAGLLCAHCGGCAIGRLQTLADNLGYVSLVAEGTTLVTQLLDSGKVDGVVGVSCLEVLEKAFPHLAAHAVPGVAIPLLRNGCRETCVDVEWIEDVLRLRSKETTRGGPDLDALRREVAGWFDPVGLRAVLGTPASGTEQIALDWLALDGKRWRPLLLTATYQALTSGTDRDVPSSVRHLAVAVECFHKASLAHDDIEDGDELRYGRRTLHREHGIPVALNSGDLLIGEGYRLITRAGFPPETTSRMLETAADGHRTLCLGQGEELLWAANPRPLGVREVLDIYRRKTAPAFEVALRLGALAAGADAELGQILRKYSEALGVAYQIRDDLQDSCEGNVGDGKAPRPSLLLALAHESAESAVQDPLQEPARRAASRVSAEEGDAGTERRERVEPRARQLLDHYRNEAIRSLADVRDGVLKRLLYRFLNRVL